MDSVVCPLCGRFDPRGRAGDRCPADGRAMVPGAEHAAHPDDTFLGRVIGGSYPLIGLLRASSVGPTYRALKEPGDREVAIKLMRPVGAVAIEPLAERLRKVMSVVCSLADPSLVKPLDYGVEPDGVLFVASELVQGLALSDLPASQKPMPPGRAVSVVCELLHGLAEAHEHGIVHGNLKPSNIVLARGPDGKEVVRLLELGVAEVIQPRDQSGIPGGQTLGTPLYASPEQAQRQAVGPQSDLYSSGVILYELVSGVPPFCRGGPAEIARAHIEAPVPPLPATLKVPAFLEKAVVRALAKSPEARFAGAPAMIRALVNLPETDSSKPAEPLAKPVSDPEAAPAQADAGEASQPKAVAPAGQPARKPDAAPAASEPAPRRSKRRLAIGGALLVLALVAGVSVFLSIRSSPADGGLFDLVRPAPSGDDDDEKFPSIGPAGEAPRTPAEKTRRRAEKLARREALRAVDAATEPPKVVEAPPETPKPAEPPAAASVPAQPEAMLVAPNRPDGSLLISCTHLCRVYVDGGLVGESPKAPIPLKAGEHQLRATNPETGETREQTIVIKSEERTRVTLTL